MAACRACGKWQRLTKLMLLHGAQVHCVCSKGFQEITSDSDGFWWATRPDLVDFEFAIFLYILGPRESAAVRRDQQTN